MTLSSEIIIKQWGSQQQLLVNIQNSFPYSQRGAKLPPHHLHVKVTAYALSNLDAQVRSGKFAFLGGSSEKRGGSEEPSSSSHQSPNTSSASIKPNTSSPNNTKGDYVGQNIFRLGYEVLGTVVQCGSDVIGFQPGDVVIGWLGMLIPNNSSYASDKVLAIYEPEVQAPVWNFVRVSAGESYTNSEDQRNLHHQLVGAILPGIRAYSAFSSGNGGTLRAGESVLITHAASSEAHLAVQVASRRGARVYCIVESDEEWVALQDLGVSIERIIDLRRENLKEVILEETGGLGLDCVLDTFGTFRISDLVPILSFHSRIITTSAEAQYNMAVCRQLLMKNISISFLFEQTFALGNIQHGRLIHILNQIVEDVKEKRIRVNIYGIFSTEKIREAHRCLESQKAFGRVLLTYSSKSTSRT